ncbi:erythromycin esterase family protein [Clostridium beijerinckii]|uniref:erythromycin esterase family protein n=1 Tax=Clostridium beijerinckii TaxID=1520 RepID=UPI00098C6212|nr:erythromycin esterase family protein [Clostridium beijerinckii]MBA8933511.1 erythromycin esterase [Clostridium beijerinckii]NOW05538.1 erythromycin esterase [Clostridium beijerinckii]NRU37710.1 erythromycin esterase [Clostridium beijerinckii]NSA99012.1 erythromycin esterase [Clostridium beijerinckii]NYC01318.1 erythromycin esterase [Clostridium beijerinckii]
MKTKKILINATTFLIGMSLLATPVTTMSAVVSNDKSWLNTNKKEIKAVTNEIKSLNSEDYEDLEFLNPILKDKTVVCLGENFHRVAEYSSMKTRIIKYLHENLGFDVIAFESGLGECATVYQDLDKLTSKDMMENSILPVWHSKETLDLFDYIKRQSKTKNPLYLTGYDMQPTSSYFITFMTSWLGTIDKNYAKEYANFETQYFPDCYKIINQYESYKHIDELNQIKNKYDPQYEKALKFIDDNREKLAAVYPNNPNIINIAKKSLEDRMKFVEAAMLDTVKSYEFRDKIMAENVEWITNVLYPGKKVILWAHNDHLAKNTSKMLVLENEKWINSFTSMGELLNKKLNDKEYVLGLYMNSGKACSITTQRNFDISPMPEGSLENNMIKSGYKYSFVDLSQQKTVSIGNSWMFNPMFAGEDGMTSEVILPMSMVFVPKEQYDGLLLIDKVNEPTLKY